MELNTTQELDFLGAYQTCLKAMETDEFTGNLCKYYLEITEALRIAMKNQGRPTGEWIMDVGVGECSHCRWLITEGDEEINNYCPHCGADMRGEE